MLLFIRGHSLHLLWTRRCSRAVSRLRACCGWGVRGWLNLVRLVARRPPTEAYVFPHSTVCFDGILSYETCARGNAVPPLFCFLRLLTSHTISRPDIPCRASPPVKSARCLAHININHQKHANETSRPLVPPPSLLHLLLVRSRDVLPPNRARRFGRRRGRRYVSTELHRLSSSTVII